MNSENAPRVPMRKPVGSALPEIPRGQVHVLPDRCKECGYCVRFCPEQVLVFSDDRNARGYRYPVVASKQQAAGRQCVDCGFCNLICPELAIFSTPLDGR